jgi:hypothetical protein
MAIVRVIYPLSGDVKIMKIFDVPQGNSLAVPNVCTKMVAEDWDSLVEAAGIEDDVIAALGITDIIDLR